jgi:hypothetical protein
MDATPAHMPSTLSQPLVIAAFALAVLTLGSACKLKVNGPGEAPLREERPTPAVPRFSASGASVDDGGGASAPVVAGSHRFRNIELGGSYRKSIATGAYFKASGGLSNGQ